MVRDIAQWSSDSLAFTRPWVQCIVPKGKKSVGEKCQLTHKGKHIKIQSDFLSATFSKIGDM